MADELDCWGAGVVIEEPSPAIIARGIGTAVREFPALRAKAQETAAACAAFHSPQALLRCLIEGTKGSLNPDQARQPSARDSGRREPPLIRG
jgi:hypothetical protein